MKLNNKNVIITGGSLGFGKALTERFLSEGCNVCICARNDIELFSVEKEFADRFPQRRILTKKCDVSNEEDVKKFIDYAVGEFKTIHVLILNAGIYGPMGSTESVSLSDWKRVIDVNLYGVLLPCRELIPHFKNNKYGKIIILSGGGATNPMPNISAYASSKAAVVRLSETISKELEDFNVDVNAISPGVMLTRMMDQVIEAGPSLVGEEFFNKNKNWKENGTYSFELGTSLAVYLAGSESDGITGKLISAQWDNWRDLKKHLCDLQQTDIYCLRRIIPEDRKMDWN